MVNNSTNNNKENNHLSLKLTEHTQGNDKWHWKFKSWLGTGTKMYDFFLHWTGCKLTYDIGNSSPGLEQAQKCVIFSCIEQDANWHMTLEIQVLAWNRHKNVWFFPLYWTVFIQLLHLLLSLVFYWGQNLIFFFTLFFNVTYIILYWSWYSHYLLWSN